MPSSDIPPPAEADPDIGEIEHAAREIGVAPGDPAWAFVAALCRDLNERKRLDAEQRREMAAILEQARTRPATDAAPEIAASLSADFARLLAPQWLRLNRAALVCAALAGAAILLLGGGGGYLAGYRHGSSSCSISAPLAGAGRKGESSLTER